MSVIEGQYLLSNNSVLRKFPEFIKYALHRASQNFNFSSLLSAIFAFCCFVFYPASAHHGSTVKFDPLQPINFEGIVTRMDWANPHAHIFMARGEAGDDWYVELESPVLLEWNGWSEDTLKPGDRIRVEGYLARDGSPQVWGERILHDGQVILSVATTALSLALEASQVRAIPRWPDGQPRMGAAPGEEGYWVPNTTVMMEEGVDVAMTSYGLLDDVSEASSVAPMQEWALRLYESRQRNFLRSDPGFVECRPPAGPRKYQAPFGIQWLEDRDWERIFVVPAGGNQDWHLIYTDGRGINTGFPVDNDNVLYYGRNVATWEGDTLVVQSEGFNEKFWLTGGLPHTSQMKVTERLTRTDFNNMAIEVTIDDPGAYTRPWSMSWKLVWKEGEDPPEYYCQDNRL